MRRVLPVLSLVGALALSPVAPSLASGELDPEPTPTATPSPTSTGEPSPEPTDEPSPEPTSSGPRRYLDPLYPGWQVHRSTHVYGRALDVTGRRVDLVLDVYQPPASDRTTRRAIVWIHGGGFLTRTTRHQPAFVAMARHFARLGYVSVSIEYRRRTAPQLRGRGLEAAVRDASHDGKAAVRWLRANARAFRVDRQRIAVGGASAGAMTALRVAYAEAPGRSGTPRQSSEVAAVVDLWGSLKWRRRAGGWMRDGAPLMEPGEAPVIAVHGTADPVVPYADAVAVRDRAAAVGIPHELRALAGAVHGAPGSTTAVRQWVAEFLDQHLT